MKTCQHCKHWRRGVLLAADWSGLFNPDGEIILVPNKEHHTKVSVTTDETSKLGECFHTANMCENTRDWLGIDEYSGDDGIVSNATYSDSHGIMETGGNFGCIHWEVIE